MKLNLSDYKEIRGILVMKRSTVFGKHYLFVSNGSNTVSLQIGKAAFDSYNIGMQLTVGYIGHRIINIRPGIVESDDTMEASE